MTTVSSSALLLSTNSADTFGPALNLTLFAGFAIASQVVLLSYFVARRLRGREADRHGWLAYAFGAVGLPTGLGLLLNGAPWQLFAGPILFAAWAAFGGWADRLARVEWRDPIRWSVFGPYVFLYLAAQMFLWWPMWDRWLTGWFVYLALFVANTGLNMVGHFGPNRTPTGQGT